MVVYPTLRPSTLNNSAPLPNIPDSDRRGLLLALMTRLCSQVLERSEESGRTSAKNVGRT